MSTSTAQTRHTSGVTAMAQVGWLESRKGTAQKKQDTTWIHQISTWRICSILRKCSVFDTPNVHLEVMLFVYSCGFQINLELTAWSVAPPRLQEVAPLHAVDVPPGIGNTARAGEYRNCIRRFSEGQDLVCGAEPNLRKIRSHLLSTSY